MQVVKQNATGESSNAGELPCPVFLMDSVYLRVEHFVRSGGLPAAALGVLLSQPTQARFGINMRRRPGRHGGNYSVEEPEALFARLPQADSTYARKVFS